MMDPFNLAICFGPTLMPAPTDADQVECQANVNAVVKTCIVHHAEIFAGGAEGTVAVGGPRYEKYACGPQPNAGELARLAIEQQRRLVHRQPAMVRTNRVQGNGDAAGRGAQATAPSSNGGPKRDGTAVMQQSVEDSRGKDLKLSPTECSSAAE